jgi:hypothetical protein
LANLIADGILDIKIALTEQNGRNWNVPSKKWDIIADSEGNKVAFSGSMNESATAYDNELRSHIDVFCSWLDEKRPSNLKRKCVYCNIGI